MYHATVAAAALHQVLLRTMTKALRNDKVVAQNVASGLFCAAFVALGVCNRPALLAIDFCFRATPSVVLELDQVESRCEAA